MDEKLYYIEFKKLQNFMINVFKGIGVPQADAEICAEVLIEADKRGIDSHGINRLKPIYYDRINDGIQLPKTEIEIVKQGPTTAVLDGHNGMGMVVSKKAMSMAVDKARQYGMGMSVVRNSTHYGIAGYYCLMAVEAGMIGITGTNARPSVAPTFGVEGMLGTNPLSFGIPSDEEFPFFLDCATSISQRGKVEYYDRQDRATPSGCVIGLDGKPRTDTHQILNDLKSGQAALTPLGGIGEDTGGYKGYGYSTVVEILSSALQAGQYLKMLSGFDANGQKVPYHLGHFFIAIDIEAFIGISDFKKTVGEILRSLRGAQKMPGFDKIYTAGEKEYLTWLERQKNGVPINSSLQNDIKTIIRELNLDDHGFPFV